MFAPNLDPSCSPLDLWFDTRPLYSALRRCEPELRAAINIYRIVLQYSTVSLTILKGLTWMALKLRQACTTLTGVPPQSLPMYCE